MTRGDIRRILLDCIIEALGDRKVPEITDRTDPIRDLGLDSEDGVAIACALTDKFGCPIPATINPLVDDSKNRSRRFGEIVSLIQQLLLPVGHA